MTCGYKRPIFALLRREAGEMRDILTNEQRRESGKGALSFTGYLPDAALEGFEGLNLF